MKNDKHTFFVCNNIKLKNRITYKLILILKLPDEIYTLQTYLEPMSLNNKKLLSDRI